MKKIALILVICMVLSLLAGCSMNDILGDNSNDNSGNHSEISDIWEMYANNITGNNASIPVDKPIKLTTKTIENILKAPTQNDVLALAKQYYDMAYPNIESATRSEYNRLVTWTPDFKDKKSIETDMVLAKKSSINTALALSYTDAKNFYLAMAAAVFSLNPEDTNSAGNLAAAVAAYGDDLELEGVNSGNLKKYYENAIKIYNYSLVTAARAGKYNNDVLPILVSLGNLYFDNEKSDEAYICFKTAHELNDEYWPAIQSLCNFYISKQQFKKALDLIADSAKYPAFIKATAKISEQQKEDAAVPGTEEGAASEGAMEIKMDKYASVDSISTADFLDDIDLEAKEKLNTLIKQVQDKMRFKVPDINLISQYSTLRSVSEPLGGSALEAFGIGVGEYDVRAEFLNAKVNIRLAGEFGMKIDLGGINTLEELEEAMKKAEANDNFNPDITVTEEEDSEEIAEKYLEELQKGLKNMKSSDMNSQTDLFKTLAKINPEYAIFTANPYDYANPVDILVQRYNVLNFNNKYLTYGGYMSVVNGRVRMGITDIINKCYERVEALTEKENEALDAIDVDDSDQAAIKVHQVHNTYRPQINNVKEVAWNQATQMAVMAFKQKIKKYAEQMYNDCMKHVILISDDNIRQYLEEKLTAQLLMGIAQAYNNVYEAYNFVTYEDPHDCGCDLGQLAALAQAEQEEREKLEKEQAKKNMEAKKRFESGELDENSEYYKKIIKPYETKISTPFFEGVVGPYKTGWRVKVDIPDVAELEFGKMQQNIRNTTSYDGGVEFGPDVDVGSTKAGIKAFLKFSATQGADGNFAVDDVDIIGGGKITFKTMTTTAEAGMTASALRGTKSHASFSVTGDNMLNDQLKSAMGNWKPKLTKEFFNGVYPIIDPK